MAITDFKAKCPWCLLKGVTFSREYRRFNGRLKRFYRAVCVGKCGYDTTYGAMPTKWAKEQLNKQKRSKVR